MDKYSQQVLALEKEWCATLADFIRAGDRAFKDRKNSDPIGFCWWMVRNHIIRNYPEIILLIQESEK